MQHAWQGWHECRGIWRSRAALLLLAGLLLLAACGAPPAAAPLPAEPPTIPPTEDTDTGVGVAALSNLPPLSSSSSSTTTIREPPAAPLLQLATLEPQRTPSPLPTPSPRPRTTAPVSATQHVTPTLPAGAPADPALPRAVVAHGGNFRSEPRIADETVIGQLCPGDTVVLLEDADPWVYLRLEQPGAPCVETHASAGTEGWLSRSLLDFGQTAAVPDPATTANPAATSGTAAPPLTPATTPPAEVEATPPPQRNAVVLPDGSLAHMPADDPLIIDGHTDRVTSLAWSSDGTILASGAWDTTVRLWNVVNGAPLMTLNGHQDGVLALAWSPDGALLASGSAATTINLWDMSSGALLTTIEGHTAPVRDVAISPDSRLLASAAGGSDATVRIWNIADGRELFALDAGNVQAITFSLDGTTLVSVSSHDDVKVWRVETGTLVSTLRLERRTAEDVAVTDVVFAPDNSTVAFASADSTVKLVSVRDGSLLRTLEGHHDVITSIAYAPDSVRLVSASQDGTLRVWGVSDGALVGTLERNDAAVAAVVWSPDGRTIASASDDGTVRLWR